MWRRGSKPTLMQQGRKKKIKRFEKTQSQSEAVELDPELGFSEDGVEYKMLPEDVLGAKHLTQFLQVFFKNPV